MKIQISASNALCKWMKLDLIRIPSVDGKKIGKQTITTDVETLAWQCHVIKNNVQSHYYTVIAVEARSRYVMIFPNLAPPTQAEFEEMFLGRLFIEMVNLMLHSGSIEESVADIVTSQFLSETEGFCWFKNTDLSVNRHVSDTESWIRQSGDNNDVTAYNDDEAYGLSMHINEIRKRIAKEGRNGRFVPVVRMLEDTLFRFAKGLARDSYPDTPNGHFPSPYPKSVEDSKQEHKAIPDNVVCLTSYRKQKLQ
ncbi:hypothetical protein PE36_17205 [Moritella sp. PE36]|uniref:hypothetical protein n=1 Tax=Moritella sp. PE36 TaxID=58051 RepID=UPI0001568686|nr:hypothetical protein [Moritella sp. PE36]EDM67421.1 hypothetical protein PE36_17205 [Moritella sp. PE36]